MVDIKNANILFSYAREDYRFVLRVASLLRKFVLPGKLYVYSKNDGSLINEEINDAFAEWSALLQECALHHEGEEAAEARTPVLVQFTQHNGSISTAQHRELNRWNEFMNGRDDAGRNAFEFKIILSTTQLQSDKFRPPVPDAELLYGRSNGLKLKPLWQDASSANWVAESILRYLMFDQREIPFATQLVEYEKDVIAEFRAIQEFEKQSQDTQDRLLERMKSGFPMIWPMASLRTDLTTKMNNYVSQDKVGKWRNDTKSLLPRATKEDEGSSEGNECGCECVDDIKSDPNSHDAVVACALTSQHTPCLMKEGLTFLEAGPRQVVIGEPGLNAAILVSGGIAPGTNAVIDGVVRRHKQYKNTANVYGIRHGFLGLKNWNWNKPITLTDDLTAKHATEGGTFLETHRLTELLEANNGEQDACLDNMLGTLRTNNISILYVVGGDGSMKAAHLLSNRARVRGEPISVVGIPKTMDNDILWVWQSFGFATAVQKAVEVMRNLYMELKSNPRICFLQLFGSASGFVVSHTVAASQTGQCDVVCIPEVDFTVNEMAQELAKIITGENRDGEVRTMPYGMVVIAETAIPKDWENYREFLTQEEAEEVGDYWAERANGRYPQGQTSDLLRSAGLKLVRKGVMKELERYIREFVPPNVTMFPARSFSSEPRHILRATEPSFSDIIIGQRLGSLAVDNAMAGYTDFMISQWLTEYVLVPLRLVSMGRKRIPESGIFWKSVRDKTR